MNSPLPCTLIVGSDSLIGSALQAHLKQINRPVVGTTKRQNTLNNMRIYLDLSRDLKTFRYPESVDVAVICAGVTTLEDCRLNPDLSAIINIKNISELVKQLVAKEIFVIYLSTDQVFDGIKPFRHPDDPPSPMTEYGSQKAEAEKESSKYGNSLAIVRLTKVLSQSSPLFVEWAKSLKNGKTIHPFKDMFMAPIPLSFVVDVISKLAEKRLSGILHISGNRDVSYAQAAYWFAAKLRYKNSLIKPIKAAESGHLEHVPQNTTLNIDRLKFELDMEPPDVKQTIESVLNG